MLLIEQTGVRTVPDIGANLFQVSNMDTRLRVPQEPVGVRLDSPVALACRFPEAFRIEYPDMAAAVAEKAGLLERVCHHRNAGPPNAHHFRDEFLGQFQVVAAL